MDRLSTSASHTSVLATVLIQQNRVQNAETQVASGKRAPDYTGLGRDAGRLLDLETVRTRLESLARNNDTVQRRLDLTDTSLTSIDETLRDFRTSLLTVGGNDPLDQQHVADLQAAAFRALQNLQASLNTEADGRYLFSGSRVTSQPVDLGLTTLADFQARFDGDQVLYPTTRDAHLSDGGALGHADTGDLTVVGATITAANASAFASVDVGVTITIAGSTNGNDGTYTVIDKPANNQLVVSKALTNATEAAATISLPASWYHGDEVAATHQVEVQRSLSLDLTAINPVFEKAIRAAGLIAQGAFGTNGGLDAHPERVSDALYLLNSAIDQTVNGTPPFGPEEPTNIDDVRRQIGYQQVLLDETRTRQEDFAANLEISASKIEDMDIHEAVAQLLEESQSLEAAYKAVARIRQLSLVDML